MNAHGRRVGLIGLVAIGAILASVLGGQRHLAGPARAADVPRAECETKAYALCQWHEAPNGQRPAAQTVRAAHPRTAAMNEHPPIAIPSGRPVPWQALLQGEYVGPPRLPHVPKYLVRAGDQLEFIYRRKREMTSEPYRLNVGDTIRVESATDEKLNRDLTIQLDGTITLAHAIQVRAAGRTIEELTAEIEERYKKLYKVPAITVTPLDTERKLQDLLSAVDSRFGAGGLIQQTIVSPEGTIQLPGIGNVPVNGLTIEEIEKEVEARYAEIVQGIGVTPRLVQIAPRFVYVGGEVRNPGRYTLEGPTTVIMAISMAGGWNFGGNLREIIVYRRADDWRLVATKLDLHDALLMGRDVCPDDIWLRDSDIVYIPKSQLLARTNAIELFFTQGLYRIIPINLSFSGNSTL